MAFLCNYGSAVVHRLSRMWALCLVLALPALAAAAPQSPSTAPAPEPVPHRAKAAPKATHRAVPSSKDADRPAEATAQRPPTPSDSVPQPASVVLNNGQLTITADNSDLSTILEKVAGDSGMSIQGLDKSARVFGQYGPASPRDVLTELLSDTGYNFVMLGGAHGTVPRELVLTAQNGKAPLPSASPGQNAASDETDNSDADYQEPLGPGAIAHPPPEPPDDPQARMQQHLQNLERMHEAQQRQQQQDNNTPQ
ncbi:MAG: hypothetical protein WA294_06370 [Acidobacteriaceae bacterium]